MSISVLIVPLIADELEQICQQGLAHPTLGEFFDGGSYAKVAGLEVGPEGMTQLIGPGLKDVAKLNGVACHDAPAPQSGSGLTVERNWLGLAETERELAQWQCHLANGGMLSLIVSDRSCQQQTLICFYSHALPCMGAMTPCSVEDVWGTWLQLAGGSLPFGRYLLEEPPSSFDPSNEELLIKRLRQLYGD